MNMSTAPPHRTLVAIPAYNEAATIRNVVERVRSNLPDCDLVVVDDGSRDATATVLAGTGATVVAHLCNLGYGRAIQTAVLYAERASYDRLVTLDADGQHDPAQVRALLAEFDSGRWDLLIGSRYVVSRSYAGVPFGRRRRHADVFDDRRHDGGPAGLRYDVGIENHRPADVRRADQLAVHRFPRGGARLSDAAWDFGSANHPITVEERRHGTTMYSALSHIKYPLKTTLMVVLGVVEASLTRRRTS